MTEEQAKELSKKLLKLIEPYEDAEFFLLVRNHETNMNFFMGDACPVCAVKLSLEWIAANRIQHRDKPEIDSDADQNVTGISDKVTKH